MERAYVFLSEDIQFEINVGEDADGVKESKLHYSFTNYGKTPAIVTGLSVFRRWYPNADLKIRNAGNEIPPGLVIGANKPWTHPVTSFPISVDEWRDASTGSGYILLAGKIAYEDIFGEAHETGFCWAYNFDLAQFVQTPNKELNYHW